MFLTTHVTVCVCHAELKGYLLTYLLTDPDPDGSEIMGSGAPLLLAILQLRVGLQNRVANETYDAETKMRLRHWSDGVEAWPRRQCHQSETIPRWDVQNNVSKRSVEIRAVTIQLIMCRPISTLLWVCIHFVTMRFNRPQCWWFKVQTRQVSGSACAMWYLLFSPNFSSLAVLKFKLLAMKCW